MGMIVGENLEETMTSDTLLQMITQNDHKHDEGHRRLRQSFLDLEDRVESNFAYLKDGFLANRARLDALERTPIDAAKIVLSPRVVVAIVATAITLAGGVWASTSGLRSDMRDILTTMNMQNEIEKTKAKLADERATSLTTAINAMKQRQELQQYELQGMKESIMQLKQQLR